MAIVGNNNLGTMAAYATALAKNNHAKRCLAFGDSWFQYPPRPIDIEKQLARRFRNTLFLNEGVVGRDSGQWKLGLPRVQREIGAFRFDAILLSIGGNDVVGEELREFVKTPAQAQAVGATAWGVIPPEVFDHVRLELFEYALGHAIRDFREVVQYRDMYSRGTILFAHTYDYIYPNGDAFRLGPVTVGPWAKPALDDVGLVDPVKQRIVTNWLVDQFARLLREYASHVPNFRIVDSRGTLGSRRQWQNEIHPTKAGFTAIVDACWVPALTGVLA
jgi:GDSL-like lipase/acylhydrolase family protein